MPNRPPCADLPASTFYPYGIDDDDDDVAEALATARTACSGCAQAGPCLAGALDRGEITGVWAGIDFERATDETGRAIEARQSGDYELMAKALEAAAHLTLRAAQGDMTRPWQEARACERCETMVQAGTHPVDQNGTGATCGYPSTYNRGCRCDKCRLGKSGYQKTKPG